MHLHWKYRELVKVICGGRCIQEVQGIAQTLETESGGILVTVERISKGFAILVYRGKNYKQPASLRPRTLLSKREALKRSIEAQRHKVKVAFCLYIRTCCTLSFIPLSATPTPTPPNTDTQSVHKHERKRKESVKLISKIVSLHFFQFRKGRLKLVFESIAFVKVSFWRTSS